MSVNMEITTTSTRLNKIPMILQSSPLPIFLMKRESSTLNLSLKMGQRIFICLKIFQMKQESAKKLGKNSNLKFVKEKITRKHLGSWI